MPENLGVRSGRLADCPDSPNCVSSQASDERHHIEPLIVTGEPSQGFARLAHILEQRADTKIVERGDHYLRVEFRTRFFVDDGEFFLDDRRLVIEIRSASRLGYSDLGKNRQRIKEIRGEFQKSALRR